MREASSIKFYKESMSSELTIVSHDQGGLGVDFSNPLFKLAPGTIAINQPNTQVDGAIKGKLRITETGQQFDEMLVTLLKMPVKQRAYYTGSSGTMNRTPDNLTCFSRDMIRPDKTAKVPQAPSCDNCPQGDTGWARWRETKDKADIPQCDVYYYALFIDTVYKLPLQMFLRSKTKKPFEDGMQELARTLYMMKSQGLNPNIYDISFKLSTKKILTGALPSYVINLSDFKAITKEQQHEFGTVYQQFFHQGQAATQEIEQEGIDADAQEIDQKVTGPLVGEYVGEDITL